MYVIAADATQYVFVIEDKAKFSTFINNYPVGSNFDPITGGFTGSLFTTFEAMQLSLRSQGFSVDNAFAYATAGLLEKFDVGVHLMQYVKNGSESAFKEMNVTPVAHIDGSFTYQATKCK
jgi:hypothetical protein